MMMMKMIPAAMRALNAAVLGGVSGDGVCEGMEQRSGGKRVDTGVDAHEIIDSDRIGIPE